MRILLITFRFLPAPGGVEYHVYNLAKKLIQYGHDVTIFTSDLYKESPITKLPKAYINHKIEGIKVRRFKAIKLLDIKHGLGIITPSILFSMLKEKIDIIHAHAYGYFPTYFSAFIRKIKSTPLIITTHTDKGTYSISKNVFNLLIGKPSLNIADHIIALTNKEAIYLETLGIKREKISVIPNGIDLESFINLPNGKSFRMKYNIRGKMILYVGRIYSCQKGLNHLINAIPIILNKEPEAKIVIVGENWGSKANLIKTAKNLGIEKSIIFTGYIPRNELLKAYAAADIFVLPSLFEPFGIVLLEAMASKKPIVATNVGGIPEVVENGKNGILVKPGNEEELANAILYLLSHEDQAKIMGINGYNMVKKYSWDLIAKKIEEVYFKVLNGEFS
jgi:glycosyltransferase involved in cell wall biosynthesis